MIFLTNIPQYTICNKKCTHVHISITKWYIMGFLQHVYHPIASEATLGRILIIITLDSWVLHGSTAKNMVRHKNTWFDTKKIHGSTQKYPLQPDFLATDESPPRYARVLTASFALLPRVLDEQQPRSPCYYPLNKSLEITESWWYTGNNEKHNTPWIYLMGYASGGPNTKYVPNNKEWDTYLAYNLIE